MNLVAGQRHGEHSEADSCLCKSRHHEESRPVAVSFQSLASSASIHFLESLA
jgi:hypothetical protein